MALRRRSAHFSAMHLPDLSLAWTRIDPWGRDPRSFHIPDASSHHHFLTWHSTFWACIQPGTQSSFPKLASIPYFLIGVITARHSSRRAILLLVFLTSLIVLCDSSKRLVGFYLSDKTNTFEWKQALTNAGDTRCAEIMRELFNTPPQYVWASCCTGAVWACQMAVKRYLSKE